MNMQTLLETARKPEIYTPGTAVMWVDEYISEQLLATHLNPDIELASRKQTTITSTIEWIVNKVPDDRLNILDLGCGPGLYTEKLAEKGHMVTGVDFSANSIAYARESAREKKLDISYLQQNYLELAEENTFDLILMIFTDFGVLSPEQREILLANVYRALKPGGKFLFDVLNTNYSLPESGPKTWELSGKGFWRDRPHLALTESFYYDEQQVALSQHIIIDEMGEMEVYRFWIHTFSPADLEKVLAEQGFGNTECYDHIIPGCEMYDADSVTFCITAK
ncbi:class I SAM-dependent methyltransferase [Thermodesulfobacteriota bacterium]